MYDRKKRRWYADCENEELLRWSREAANLKQPESQFIRASMLLTDLSDGSDVAEAVELMEAAAKQEYPKAMFAMGQMFEWGWGVNKDRKTALEWYHKAADAGSRDAQKALSDMKRRRIINIASIVGAVAVCVAAVIGIIYAVRTMDGKITISVNPKTELTQTTTLEDFNTELQGLIAEYDDELVISGQVSTNRLILKFEGEHLDLSDFLADKVVARENNQIIIQFSSEEEANRCLEELKQRGDIAYVELDEYSTKKESIDPDYSSLPTLRSTDPQNGVFSWGVLDMGLDQLSAYVAQYHSSKEILVAVVDSGMLVHSDMADRVVFTYNMVTGGDPAIDEHGTHVAGTVLDGTRGTNTYVMALDVFNGEDGASSMVIASAIEAAVNSGAAVINLSLGGSNHSDVKEYAIREAVEAGVVVVQAAGNESDSTANHCASEMTGPIVVAAYDIRHDDAYFTNYGSSVDVSAPGVDIYSYCHEADNLLVSLDGTSMAAPHVTALVALVRTIYPNATPAEVEQYIMDSCRTYRNPDLYETGMYGAGAPDGTAFIETYID